MTLLLRQVLVAVCTVTTQCAAEVGMTRPLQAATRAHSELVAAVIEGRMNDVRTMVHPLGFPNSVALEIQENFTANLTGQRNAGVWLIQERIRHADTFAEGSRYAVFFRVTSFFEHPLAREGIISQHRTTVAISEDGETWRFNGLGCFSQVHMKHLFPTYAGLPRIEE